MVSCAHLSVALRVALGASTWPGKRGFTIRRSSPTQRRNGRAFASLTARGGGLPIGVTPTAEPPCAYSTLGGECDLRRVECPLASGTRAGQASTYQVHRG